MDGDDRQRARRTFRDLDGTVDRAIDRSLPTSSQSPTAGLSGREDRRAPPLRQPIQFGVRTLLAVTLAVGVLCAGMGWLGVSPFGRGLLLVLLLISLVAGAGLVVALAHAADDR